MYVDKDFIFLELQKTGGSHILRLLSQLTDGDTSGKHNRLLLQDKDKFIFGSIRNPWDWYISLWAYGVSGKGAIRRHVTHKNNIDYYYKLLPKSMGKNWISLSELILAGYNDLFKPCDKWLSSYQSTSEPELFRSWLRFMLSSNRRYDIGEGYAFSPISKCAGLMTYRYLRLFTLGDLVYKDKALSSLEGIKSFDSDYNISNGMIRNEHLEDDLITVLQEAGRLLSQEEILSLKNKTKTNASKRKSTDFYYDQETINLVANKEKFIINKYEYMPPTL